MKPKLTFLLSLTFLFLFSGSSAVFSDFYSHIEKEDGTYSIRIPHGNGTLSHEITRKNGKKHGPTTEWNEKTGKREHEINYKNGY
jgi:antitoxin component YwqK of YwqJK toxin-antitoxin module